ncbi:hypothetical protein GO988_21085 [Hymenobacter sp. HMF4947]|uniref:Uncharacterized protein n=1 Tax=Hymenobacter ginkgonis TaxID=2682976 RepID=A0A7K1TKE2_9BACT|nr:hypothetical protein [Hymenobacter ginkgonis]MVN78833.1 hypothetical protein [Hymenobacter ginkgonis]
MKFLLPLLLLTGSAFAQRPTAEPVPQATDFWPLDAPTGTVVFRAPTARPRVPALRQAEHLRAWLSSTCADWKELPSQADSTQFYRGQLRGVHAGGLLSFAVRVCRRPLVGWQYMLLGFRVGAPTGAGSVQWVPLHRVLDDRDYQPDVSSFQQQLQRALPGL